MNATNQAETRAQYAEHLAISPHLLTGSTRAWDDEPIAVRSRLFAEAERRLAAVRKESSQ